MLLILCEDFMNGILHFILVFLLLLCSCKQEISSNRKLELHTSKSDKTEKSNSSLKLQTLTNDKEDYIDDETTDETENEPDNKPLDEQEILKLIEVLSNPSEFKEHQKIKEKLLSNTKIVQPILLKHLNKSIKCFRTILEILAEIGDVDCLEFLINELGEYKIEDFNQSMKTRSRSIIIAIRRMTGKRIDKGGVWGRNYTPEIKDAYKSWFSENKSL